MITGLDFEIDISEFLAIIDRNPLYIAWWFFIHGGWIVFLLLFLWLMLQFWLSYRRSKHMQDWTYVLLAIDIPRNNEQSPKAVESIFIALTGAMKYDAKTLIGKYWHGVLQDRFSFEIISVEGYIQFLVRVPTQYRDLIEAAIYAQYPEAEIFEVDDYVQNVPLKFPNAEYDLWGSDITLLNKSIYPIKTYPFFEHELSQELKDPMAGLLEVMSKLGKGEQLWIQIVVATTDDSWKEGEEDIIKKLMGAQVEVKKNIVDHFVDGVMALLDKVSEAILPSGVEETASTSREGGAPNVVPYLSPGERNIVEALQKKIAKIGFTTKIRMIYLGRKEVFSKSKGVAAVLGALQQYTSLDLNGFRVHARTFTREGYVFKERGKIKRQNKVIRNYIKRSIHSGAEPYILNTEELATIYHFPMITVKAPLVKTVESKKSESPMGLPATEEGVEEIGKREADLQRAVEERVAKVEENYVSVAEEAMVEGGKGSRASDSEPPVNLPIG